MIALHCAMRSAAGVSFPSHAFQALSMTAADAGRGKASDPHKARPCNVRIEKNVPRVRMKIALFDQRGGQPRAHWSRERRGRFKSGGFGGGIGREGLCM